MAKRTIQWPKEQYNDQKNNTMAKRTIQWPKEQYNGQKKKDGKQWSTKHYTENYEFRGPISDSVCVWEGGGQC
jgi:hypothetical protein